MAVQVTGIFFESKVDYTTWFGDNVEYIPDDYPRDSGEQAYIVPH